MLATIERATRQKIEPMEVPSVDAANTVRVELFKKKISETLAGDEWKNFTGVMENYTRENKVAPLEVAAALAAMFHGDRPFLLSKAQEKPAFSKHGTGSQRGQYVHPSPGPNVPQTSTMWSIPRTEMSRERKSWPAKTSPSGRLAGLGAPGTPPSLDDRPEEKPKKTSEGRVRHHDENEIRRPRHSNDHSENEEGKVRYRIEVGRFHGVRPGQIMGAIAGETGIDGKSIGRIALHQEFSTVDLPDTMSEAHLKKLKRVRVVGRALMITKFDPDRPDQEITPHSQSRSKDGPISDRFSRRHQGKPKPRR